MSELTLTLLRLGLLALLWVFVFSLAAVMRRDLYGTRVSRRTARKARKAQQVPAGAVPAAAAGTAPSGSPPAGAPAPAAPAAAAGQKQARGRRLPTMLVVTEGRMTGTTIPLGRAGVLIGRAPECSLVLDDEFASSRHARIFPRAEGWFVEDLGSRNGTLAGGQKVVGAVPVEVGTTLRIGRTTVELRG